MGYVYLMNDGYIPDRRKVVAVNTIHGWMSRPRSETDYLGKRHLNTFKDDEGKVIGYGWLTSEQRLEGSLLKGQTLREYRELQRKYDQENVIE